MLWWHWAVLGLALAGLEILTPGGFYLIFFGLGGLAVAVLALLGVAGPLWFQLLLFSLFSIVSLGFFRNPLLRMMQRKPDGPPASIVLVGELATPVGPWRREPSGRPNCGEPPGPHATSAANHTGRLPVPGDGGGRPCHYDRT